MAKKELLTETNLSENKLFESTEIVIKKAKSLLMSETLGTEVFLKQLQETYQNIVVSDIKDISSYDFVVKGAKELKKYRTSIESKRKELTEPALKFQRDLKAEADRLIQFIEPLESNLLKQKTIFEDLTKAEADRIFSDRINTLSESGFVLIGGFYVSGIIQLQAKQITEMDDDNFNFYVETGKKELDRQKKETERKDAEKKELEQTKNELAQLRAEIAKEREELANEKAELSAQKLAIDKTYTELEKEAVNVKETAIDDAVNVNVSSIPFGVLPDVNHQNLSIEKVSEPIENKTIKAEETYISPRQQGFDEFRDQLLIKLRNPEKFTRETLIQFVIDLKL